MTNISSFIFSIFLSLFLVLPKIGIVDLTIIPLILVFFYQIIKGKLYFKFSWPIYYALLIVVFISFWAIFSSLINHGSFYSEFLFKPFRVIVVLLLLNFNFQLYDNEKLVSIVINSIIIAATINAMVVLIQYFNGVTGFGDPLFLKSSAFGDLDTPYRKPGITAGYPVTGMLSLFGVLCSFWMYYVNRKSVIYFLSFSLSLFGLLLGARTTLLIFFLFSPILFIWVARLNKAKFTFLSIVVIGFILYIISQYFINDYIKGTVDVMFANFFNYFSTGDALDYSSKDLVENHYKLPISIKDIVFGNSLPPRLSPVNTDVSYIRIWWSNGIIGLLLYLSHVLLLLYTALSSSIDKGSKVFILLMFTSVIIASFKGPFIFSRMSYDILIMLALAVFSSKTLKVNS
ncbi:hypothetical protein [Vibrio splendidus]|uniref:hypothetical protein n=1 Tax=Vibrio splendidus TaxID=29497 RepID=UPI000D33FD06|nr:hypothetical protein [Vibrio splendidus]PTP29384.1 hypothetical protein CWN92_11760 [Vibrio splendidus]